MVGADWEYFAPYIMHNYHDLDTVLTIQNSGDACTSIWIYYKQQGNCECMKAQHVEQIMPGEAIRIGPEVDQFGVDMEFPGPDECSPGNGDWVGSAFITANEPLAIVVDQLSLTGNDKGTLLSMRGLPYDQQEERVWYADLLYRELSGWQSSIQVQNLTRTSVPTFVTVEFFDQSGDSILFIGDWVCRNGAETFYLPAIVDLGVNYPFGYVGAAEIMSHQQVDYPGEHHKTGEPIFAVVDLKKDKLWDEGMNTWRHTYPGESQGGAYNAHPEHQKENAAGWAMPYIAKEQNGVTSRIAIRNNANCNKIKGKIWIQDETGRTVGVVDVPWLHPKHMKIVDLAYFGNISRGFVGAARFEVGAWVDEVWNVAAGVEQLCDDDQDGHVDQLPVMPSVVVLNYGFDKELPIGNGAGPITDMEGDLTRVYEAFPYTKEYMDCYGELFGEVSVRQENHGFDRAEINGAYVYADDLEAMTDSTGGYQITDVLAGEVTMAVTKTGFFDGEATPEVFCGESTLQDFELVCSNPLYVTVEDTDLNAIPGATVTVSATYQYNADTTEEYETTGETNNAGVLILDVAGAADLDIAVTAAGHDPILLGGTSEVLGLTSEDEENGNCYKTYLTGTPPLQHGLNMCKWNTVVGTVFIGGLPAAGYTLEAYDMSDATMPMVDSDVTTADGVFSLENFSELYTYRINLLSPSGTFISTTGDFGFDTHCGDTGVISYTNGAWDAIPIAEWN
jgi:hypothetical protein